VNQVGKTMARALVAMTLTLGLGVAASSAVNASQPLTTGCNQITETNFPANGKVSDWVTANVQAASSVISVWHFDNGTQKYKASYFQEAAVPVDQPTFTQPVDSFFICVGTSATAP
jgi:hypothetical protein